MEKDRHIDQQYFMHSETARNPWSNYSDPYFVNNADVQDYQEEIVEKEKEMKNNKNNIFKNKKQKQKQDDAQRKYGDFKANKSDFTSTSERDSYSQSYENFLADTESAANYHYGNNLNNKNMQQNLHTQEYNNKNNTFDTKNINKENQPQHWQSTQNNQSKLCDNTQNYKQYDENPKPWLNTQNYNSEEYSDVFQKENQRNAQNYNTESVKYGKNTNNTNQTSNIQNANQQNNQNQQKQNNYFEAYDNQQSHINYNTSPGQTGEYNCCGCNNINNELEDCCPTDVKNYKNEGRAKNTAYNEKTINTDKNYNYYDTDYAINDAKNKDNNNLAIDTMSACSSNKTQNEKQKQNNSNNKTENKN